MKNRVSIRFSYFLSFVVVACFIVVSFYLQIYKGLTPCPLCILQRAMMIFLSIIFLIGILFRFKKIGYLFLSILCMLVSMAGMCFAGRQAWLQHMPQMGEGGCGVSLQYLFSILPFTDVIKMVWQGGAECSELGWVFFGLSLAEWSFVTFGVFFIFALLQFKRALNHSF